MTKAATISEPKKTHPAGPIVRGSGLSKSFRMGDSVVQVLQDVNLSIAAGEFIAIEGRSGSGKSTLLHVLGALDSPSKGGVYFEGQEYTRIAPENARRGAIGVLTGKWFVWLAVGLMLLPPIFILLHLANTGEGGELTWTKWLKVAAGNVIAGLLVLIPVSLAWLIRTIRAHKDDKVSARIRNREFGFVFQFYHLLPELNVVENTMLGQMVRYSTFSYFGQRRALRERAIEVLTQLGMSHRLTHRPNQLSGGERQRVAIARALMNKPRVLFADEPTGNLDAETGRQIMDLLEKLHRDENQTIVMVTHDRALAREADRVLVLKEGKLVKTD